MRETHFLDPAQEKTRTWPGRSWLSADSLPADLQAEGARRVQWLALMVASIGVVGTIVENIAGLKTGPVLLNKAVVIPLLVASIAIFVLGRRGILSGRALLRIAPAYQILGAAGLAIVSNAHPWPEEITLLGWSPVAVWTLLFPIVVPSSTGRTIVTSVVSLALDPLSVGIYVKLGVMPPPATTVLVLRFFPSALALVLAVLVSRLVHGLGRKLSAARELGSYRLVERLGRGGMGEVWRATHRMLARPAAVKLIRPAALESDGGSLGSAKKRFEREAQATAALRSPHTIGIFDYGVAADGSFYYVMELLDGMDFDSLVKLDGPQPPERVAHLLRQACHSLHEAHRAGLIHRDIKPANLFVCRYGADLDFVKVLDFGLVAEQRRDPEATALTGQHALTGTPAYIAPEIARGRGEVDGRADVYALGCVAYWLLTGALVFEADNLLAMLMSHLTEAPVPPSARVDRPIPAALEALVLSCLEKDPARRPASARALSDQLAALALEPAWTEHRAAEWWEEIEPALKARVSARSVDLGP